MKKIVSILLCAALMAGLCACGQKPVQTDPVKTVKSAEQLVHYGSYSDIYAALKKAREQDASGGYSGRPGVFNAAAATGTAADKTAATGAETSASAGTQNVAAAPDYSATNVQVAGVDEGDIVKTDGKNIYAIKDRELLIYQPDGASTKLLSRVTLSGENDGKYPMSILRSRLFEAERAKRDAAVAAERKSQIGTGDRSDRIRTYNFPQNRVTDHRLTGEGRSFNIDTVINGGLDPLIDALAAQEQTEKLKEQSI